MERGIAAAGMIEICSGDSSPNPAMTIDAAISPRSAGGFCSRVCGTGLLSFPPARMLRLLVGDSSISARMACRSSVAEMTGKSKTNAQPKASRHCNEVEPCLRLTGVEFRHNR